MGGKRRREGFFLLLGAFSKSFLKAVLFILNFGQTTHHNKSNAPA
jgi:hypothetical protein